MSWSNDKELLLGVDAISWNYLKKRNSTHQNAYLFGCIKEAQMCTMCIKCCLLCDIIGYTSL